MPDLTQPTAFPGWSDLLPWDAGQSGTLLLLDFDGTLSDIAPRPEDATLRPGNADLLESLNRKPGSTVGILSGRSLDDVRRRVGVPGLEYGGNHGLEIAGPHLQYRHPHAAAAIAQFAELAALLDASLAAIPGARVENKTLTLTVHYRQTPAEHHARVGAIVNDAAEPAIAAGTARITTAKAAIELRPSIDWNKGRALELIRSRLAPDAFPIYIGDDATDEDAFGAAQAAGGFGIFVGPSDSATRAGYRLDSPAAVTDALAELASEKSPLP
ncbi:MAG: trehalose-phosphatase [Chloroflexi bacterium]|nr:trehalose-phosphatase [Chloroflexota bacterium]